MGRWGAGCPRSWWWGVTWALGASAHAPLWRWTYDLYTVPLSKSASFRLVNMGNPAFNVLLCQKKKSSLKRELTSVKQVLYFRIWMQCLNPRTLLNRMWVHLASNAFSPFLAIWLWAQRSGYESCSCFQSLQYRLCWKPLSQSRAAQMVLGEVSVPLI